MEYDAKDLTDKELIIMDYMQYRNQHGKSDRYLWIQNKVGDKKDHRKNCWIKVI